MASSHLFIYSFHLFHICVAWLEVNSLKNNWGQKKPYAHESPPFTSTTRRNVVQQAFGGAGMRKKDILRMKKSLCTWEQIYYAPYLNNLRTKLPAVVFAIQDFCCFFKVIFRLIPFTQRSLLPATSLKQKALTLFKLCLV